MDVPDSVAPQEVYLLPLTDDGAPDVSGGYVYLPPPSNPPYVVRFAIEGTSSICREGSLWVNLPARGEYFRRNHFREYKWVLRLSEVLHILIFPEIKASPRFQSDPRDRHTNLFRRRFRLLHNIHTSTRIFGCRNVNTYTNKDSHILH